MKTFRQIPQNNAGFLTAEFLFAFTMVIGCGIVIFALTFSLTTIEIAQYIAWSSARAFAVGNNDFTPNSSGGSGDNKKAGEAKYAALTAAFPLLTGRSNSPWFRMPTTTDTTEFIIGDLSKSMRDAGIDENNAASPDGEARHPWVGVGTSIDLILFKGLQIPFLGKITTSPDDFKFPIRALLFRHPSVKECQDFFARKFTDGVKKIRAETAWAGTFEAQVIDPKKHPFDDNGC